VAVHWTPAACGTFVGGGFKVGSLVGGFFMKIPGIINEINKSTKTEKISISYLFCVLF